MDQFKFKKSHTVIIFLLFVSLFSLVFLLLPLLLQSLNQFFNFTIAKSYMFLLCNGLLVFIAMNSGLINASSSTTSTQVPFQTPEIGISEFKESHMEAAAEAEHPEEEEEEQSSLVMEDSHKEEEEEEEGNNRIMIIEEEEEGEEEEGNNDWVMIMEEEQEEEHEAEEDAQELNKKCEDFIRKMKAAFCSEPRDYYNYDYNHKALVAVM